MKAPDIEIECGSPSLFSIIGGRLAELGLRACWTCHVWKPMPRFAQLTYAPDGRAKRDTICEACQAEGGK